MPTNALKSQKTSSNLGDLYIDIGEKRRIETNTLYLIFCDLQESNCGFTRLRKQSQHNKSSFCFPIKLQDMNDQCWNSKNQRHYSRDLQDENLYLFYIE